MAILGLLANLVSHPNLVAICLPKNASTIIFMAMMNNVQLGSDGCPSTNQEGIWHRALYIFDEIIDAKPIEGIPESTL